MRRLRLRGMRLGLWVCGIQLLLGLAMTGLFGWQFSAQAAKAAFYGSLVAIVPTLYFALHMLPSFWPNDARSRRILLVLGQGGKWLLTILMFAVGALVYSHEAGPLLVSYVVCQLTYWWALTITG